MTFARIKPWLLRLFVILAMFEVMALHLNRRPLPLVAREIRLGPKDEYYPRLICELHNDRLTPVRYWAARDDMPVYSMSRQNGPSGMNNWCVSGMDHLLVPFSSREVWIPVSEADLNSSSEVSVSLFYTDTSLLSWLTWRWADDRRTTVHVSLKELPRTKEPDSRSGH